MDNDQCMQDCVSEDTKTSSIELLRLPPELIYIIVSHIRQIKSICQLEKTCRFFQDISGEQSIIAAVLHERSANTLSDNEIIRLISSCLFLPSDVEHVTMLDTTAVNHQLMRRAIHTAHLTAAYPLEIFLQKFNFCKPIIKEILKECVANKDRFEEMDDEYYEKNHHGESCIDFVIAQVNRILYTYRLPTPLIPRRSRTGFYGPSCKLDDIKIREHEFNSAIKLLA